MRFCRRSCLHLALLVLLLSFIPSLTLALEGDLDGDNRLTAADAARLARRAGEDNQSYDAAYDFTMNGAIDSTDARALLYAATGQIPDLVRFRERVTTGLCDERLFDRFSYTGTIREEDCYKSESVSITMTRHIQVKPNHLAYFVADIYVQELGCFQTGTWKDSGLTRYRDVPDLAKRHDAILAINGDFYKARNEGPAIRNGEEVQSTFTKRRDVLIMTYDGRMQVLPKKTLQREALYALNPYQSWIFGPGLLNEAGEPLTYFESNVTGRNPRTAIGYYEPGHYCFVVVDGRQEDYSGGLSMRSLAILMNELGCKVAYNLDGGETSAMSLYGELVNQPYRNGRAVSDIVFIKDNP